jgi:hypothetical protein
MIAPEVFQRSMPKPLKKKKPAKASSNRLLTKKAKKAKNS